MPKERRVDTLTQSFEELREDLADIQHLADSAEQKLRAFQKIVDRHRDFFLQETRAMILEGLRHPVAAYERIHAELQTGLKELRHADTLESLQAAIRLKKRVMDELRSLQAISAGFISALEWQSPSYAHTLTSQAGSKTGKIKGMISDYKRDQHADAEIYEAAFRRAYVQAPIYLPIQAYATSSGMAAFSTIVAALQSDIGSHDVVLVGRATYFQNKKILQSTFGARIRWVDEMDSDALIRAVAQEKPRAIFLDTLCNDGSMAMLDLERLIPSLAHAVTEPTFLVLDNSTLSIACQPFKHLSPFSKLRIIMMESLNKYHQFGFDRVTGGMMWTVGLATNNLFSARRDWGTNIPDASVFSLPTPDRAVLERRLQRFERNAIHVAIALEEAIHHLTKMSPYESIVYPGLESYPGYAWTRRMSFHGSSFVIRFRPEHRQTSTYVSFLNTILARAKKQQIDLVAGTSFGFDVTRIYLTASNAQGTAEPFVRISVGTECAWELERLKEVFIEVMKGSR